MSASHSVSSSTVSPRPVPPPVPTAPPVCAPPVSLRPQSATDVKPVRAAASATPDEDSSDDEPKTLVEQLVGVFRSREMVVTEVSSGVHFLLILFLALIHLPSTLRRPPTVLAASVQEREAPRPDIHERPDLEQPTMTAAGPAVRQSQVPSAPTPQLVNIGFSQVPKSLPSLNDMVLRDAVRTGGDGGIDAVSFFGASSYATRVVFVVDNSQSMRGKKFAKCKEELLTAVSNLSPRQKFYVVFFSDDEHPMLEPNYPSDLLSLDTKTWFSFHNWVEALELKRGTRAKSSLKRAFSLKPDVIFLLTDGQFTDNAEEYLMSMEETKVRIHTIGFQANAKGKETLKDISKKFHGEFSDIR